MHDQQLLHQKLVEGLKRVTNFNYSGQSRKHHVQSWAYQDIRLVPSWFNNVFNIFDLYLCINIHTASLCLSHGVLTLGWQSRHRHIELPATERQPRSSFSWGASRPRLAPCTCCRKRCVRSRSPSGLKKKHLVNFWTKIRSERLNDFHETYLGFRFLIMIKASYYQVYLITHFAYWEKANIVEGANKSKLGRMLEVLVPSWKPKQWCCK